jgi:hypothetical protein
MFDYGRLGGPVVPRTTRVVTGINTRQFSIGASDINLSRANTASRPTLSCGMSTVVSGGRESALGAKLSTPTIDKSSGTCTPRFLAAEIIANPKLSFAQKTAVGGLANSSQCRSWDSVDLAIQLSSYATSSGSYTFLGSVNHHTVNAAVKVRPVVVAVAYRFGIEQKSVIL